MKKAVLGLAFVVICIALRSSAWEKDLHYGLTKWLAFKAGFSLENAEIIALRTEAPDEGKLYPAVGVLSMPPAPDAIRTYPKSCSSFISPDTALYPDPDKRRVDPGIHDNASTDMVQKEVQANLPNQPPDTTLTNLGVALHPLEIHGHTRASQIAPSSAPKSFSGVIPLIGMAGVVMTPI